MCQEPLETGAGQQRIQRPTVMAAFQRVAVKDFLSQLTSKMEIQ